MQEGRSATTVSPPASVATQTVTFTQLLAQVSDLSALTELPSASYTLRQFSSYNREQELGTPDWHQNKDKGYSLYDGAVAAETPFFAKAPAPGAPTVPPAGTFAAGTRIGLDWRKPAVGDYVWAYAARMESQPLGKLTPQGYVLKSSMTPDPAGRVIVDTQGPGAIMRIWSANAESAGKVRIYIDDAPAPVIEAPFVDLFSGAFSAPAGGGAIQPFPAPLAHVASLGQNLYFPIAYAKRCKIAIEGSEIFYQVDVRKYAQGTSVEPFSFAQVASHMADVQRAAAALQAAVDPTANKGPADHPNGVTLAPGAKVEVAHVDAATVRGGTGAGGAAIKGVAFEVSSADLATTLRQVLVEATFDDDTVPQVRAPLGDLFASAPGANPYASLAFRVAPGATPSSVRLEAAWPMPFAQSARILLTNDSGAPATIGVAVATAPYDWGPRSLHFHAKWRTALLPTIPKRDWRFAGLTGAGAYVGTALSVDNPLSTWWGEGDERVYVDGEVFPSILGTGTEDYFGYAWCSCVLFQHALHNQTRCDGDPSAERCKGNLGYTALSRLHVGDAIPFTQSLNFDMEITHWDKTNVRYAATSYWYASPGSRDDYPEITAAMLQRSSKRATP
jgi:hypothetical protein